MYVVSGGDISKKAPLEYEAKSNEHKYHTGLLCNRFIEDNDIDYDDLSSKSIKTFEELSLKLSSERLEWNPYQKRMLRRTKANLPKKVIVKQPDPQKKTHSIYEDVDKLYQNKFVPQPRVTDFSADQNVCFNRSKPEQSFGTPLQICAFSLHFTNCRQLFEMMNGFATKERRFLYPLGTIIQKTFSGDVHEGKIVSIIESDPILYHVKYKTEIVRISMKMNATRTLSKNKRIHQRTNRS